jgi:penicillin G amidase
MKFIKLILRGLLYALLALAAAIAVYVWRSHPTLAGELSATDLKQRVQIKRDASDVTHIMAANEPDAAFALGYTHAQERSWQLETNRRLMYGQLSQVFGTATVDTDKLMRNLAVPQAAQAQYEKLPPNIKAVMQAYVAGINSFHATSSQALPPEFHVLRTQPGLWQPHDSLGWNIIMALDLGGNWGNEFARFSSLQNISTLALWQLMPSYPGEKPATSVDLAQLYRELGVYASASPSTPAVATKSVANNIINTEAVSDLGSFSLKNMLSSLAPQEYVTFSQDAGTVEGKGSNNWIVAGKNTASGKPLVANDPHLGLGAPAIWYFTRLKVESTGLDVIGASLPGIPFVVLGRNAKVAWGFTNTGPDVQDLYLERINPANPQQYQTPEGWKDFVQVPEVIQVKGQPDLTYTRRATRHGAVLSDIQPQYDAVLDKSKYAIALRWSALDEDNASALAGWNAQKANSVEELFKAYADYHSPMQNVVAADTAGGVRYKAIGRTPIRGKDNDIRGIAPAPGWLAKYDWQGYLPYEQTPSDDVVTRGWHATANQRIHAADFAHFMGQDWATPERQTRAEALLAQGLEDGKKHDMASMQRIQADTVSLNALKFLPVIRAVQSSHPLASTAQLALKALHEELKGDMRADSAAPLILGAWADELVRSLVVAKLGEDKFKPLYGKRHFRGLIEQIYVEKNAAAAATWCAPQSCEQRSQEAFNKALDRLSAKYSANINSWRWGQAHLARSIHRPFGNVKPLAQYFDVTVPTGGDPWTLNVGQYWLSEAEPFHNRHAASLRHVFDLSDLEKSQFIYQTGQSGLVWSSRYRDMSSTWAAVQYRSLKLAPASFKSEMVLTPR